MGGDTIETKIKEYQIRHRIPIEDLSKICGVSKQMIYYWRDYGVRNWTTALKLSRKLKCKPEEIIGVIND